VAAWAGWISDPLRQAKYQRARCRPRPFVAALQQSDPEKFAKLRSDFEAVFRDAYEDNTIRAPFLMTRATKV
jgi:hypothetical protein